MLIYSDSLAKALATHKFVVSDDKSLQACSDCGLTIPKKSTMGSYSVAKVSPCPGPSQEGSNDSASS